MRLRCIGVVCIALSTILHLRLSMPGPSTQFSTADNPVAKVSSILTRFYTFTYLPVFNFKLLLYPNTLSFDWGMDAIPRITTLFEFRNLISLIFYVALGQAVMKNLNFLRKTMPKLMNNKRIGRSINKKKYHKRLHDELQQNNHQNHEDHESYCILCKQEFNFRHSDSELRPRINGTTTLIGATNGIVNHHVPSCTRAGCTRINNKFISLSPLKQYIRHNNNYNLISDNNYNYSYSNGSVHSSNSTSTHSDLIKDNNNNYSVINQNGNINSQNYSYINFNHNLNSNKFSVKNGTIIANHSKVSISVAKLDKCEKSVIDCKTNSASAILISITILTLPFLPAANLFFYVGFVVAERILYLPSVGYCLLIGLGLGKLINLNFNTTKCKTSTSSLLSASATTKAKHKYDKVHETNVKSIVTILFLVILICVYSVKTITRNMDWRDEESLYRSAVTVNPPKGKRT